MNRFDTGCSTFDVQTRKEVDVEIGHVEALAAKYPDSANDLRALSR